MITARDRRSVLGTGDRRNFLITRDRRSVLGTRDHYQGKEISAVGTGDRYSVVYMKYVSWMHINASFSCVCLVIDQKFRHHSVKVAADPRGDSRVDPQTTLTM